MCTQCDNPSDKQLGKTCTLIGMFLNISPSLALSDNPRVTFKARSFCLIFYGFEISLPLVLRYSSFSFIHFHVLLIKRADRRYEISSGLLLHRFLPKSSKKLASCLDQAVSQNGVVNTRKPVAR